MTEEIELFDPINVDSLVESERIASIEFFDVFGVGGAGATPQTLDVQAAEDIPNFTFITVTGFIADSDNLAHFGKVIGIVQTAALTGFIASAVDEGEITNLAWAWTPGQVLFINGTTISATPPASGFSQMVAIARNANIIIVRLEPPVLL